MQAVVRQVPGLSSPLAQTLPSGIARTEQLLLVHRHLDLPFVPSYVARHGGWVLDRVLHTLGSRGTGWWTTITARLRAQQALQQHVAGSRYVLLDPRNYALSCRAKSNAGPLGTLQGTVEFESLQQLSRLVDGEEDDLPPPPQVRSTLRRGLLGGHELRGEVALHGHYQTNSGEELEIPRVISLDVASDKRKGGIRYQAGAYHTVSKLGTDAPEDLEAGAGPELERRDFFQAALSVEQEFSLWKQPRAEATGGGGWGGAWGRRVWSARQWAVGLVGLAELPMGEEGAARGRHTPAAPAPFPAAYQCPPLEAAHLRCRRRRGLGPGPPAAHGGFPGRPGGPGAGGRQVVDPEGVHRPVLEAPLRVGLPERAAGGLHTELPRLHQPVCALGRRPSRDLCLPALGEQAAAHGAVDLGIRLAGADLRVHVCEGEQPAQPRRELLPVTADCGAPAAAGRQLL